MKYKIFDYSDLFGVYSIQGVGDGVFANVRPLELSDEESLIFISPNRIDREYWFSTTIAKVIICHTEDDFTPRDNQVFIKVRDPRLVYAKVLTRLFGTERHFGGIHPTAIVDPTAKIHHSVFIGAYTQIGCCTIGESSIIESHCRIMDQTVIGRNCKIDSGVIIGSNGFGYVREESGEMLRFPHIGGVSIGDNVDIGANTCIDRGGLGMTTIGNGSKIDNLVHIAHNVQIGKRCSIVAASMIGGSTVIGDDVWIGPNVSISDKIHVGDRAYVTIGSVVTKDIPVGAKVTGNFAIDHQRFISNLKKSVS